MDRLLDILQWMLPAGFGIWQILLIRTYRRLNKTKAISDTRDVWQSIAESNNETLLQQNDEIRKLRESLARVERILFRISACRHYDLCPVKPELQDYKTSFTDKQGRQPFIQRKNNRKARDNPSFEGDIETEDGRPP